MPSLEEQGKWSRKHAECVRCGLTENPHQAKGLCTLCYYRKYHSEHENQYKESNKQWRIRNRDKLNAYHREWNAKRKQRSYE